jgi:hypothetical protein
MTQTITMRGFDTLRNIPVRMTHAEFFKLKAELREYSASHPSDVRPGKRWLRHDGIHHPHMMPDEAVWLLCEYGPVHLDERGHEVCETLYKRIEFVDVDGNLIGKPKER